MIEGPDEVCEACSYLAEEGCTNPSEDEIRKVDEEALEILGLEVGDLVRMEDVRDVLRTKSDELLDHCEGCEFRDACEPEVRAFIEGSEA